MLRASATPTHPNASIPPTTHTKQHHLIPYGATQRHSGGNIEYVFCYSRTMVTNNNQTHVHPCKHIALDLQMHKHRLKLHHHIISILTIKKNRACRVAGFSAQQHHLHLLTWPYFGTLTHKRPYTLKTTHNMPLSAHKLPPLSSHHDT